ncbi:MAG: hypothetical protein HOE82_08460 [Gammaproteobacteria bacterium]|jgi:hypothetical protein|nr:hypothetical protein [Gammaproteobacteria bacterium]
MKNIMEIADEFAPTHLIAIEVMSQCRLYQDPLQFWMGEEFEATEDHYNDVVFNIEEGKRRNDGFQVYSAI